MGFDQGDFMRVTSVIAAIAIAVSVGPSFAIEDSGPVAIAHRITVCRNILDHARSMDFKKTDPIAWEHFGRETHADGRDWTILAGTRAFAMSRMWDPSSVECIRIEGGTECGWGLAVVVLTIEQNEKRAEAKKRDTEAATAKAPEASGRR